MKTDPIIVAYHTGGAYRTEVHRLAVSLKFLGLHHRIYELPSLGTWRANAHIRPQFLMDVRREYPDRPLVSVDVDTFVHSDPMEFFASLTDCDIAVHYLRDDELLPGTLLINTTPAAEGFLYVWHELNLAHPARNDRANCRAAADQTVKNAGLRIHRLGPSYAFIFDTSRRVYPGIEPVIEHLQASRRLKQEIDYGPR